MRLIDKTYLFGHMTVYVGAAAIILTLAGCQAVDVPDAGGQTPVSFVPKGIDEDERATKASAVTSLDASGFYASAVTGSEGADAAAWTSVHFSKTGGSFTGNKYWPATNPSYRFYASNIPLSYGATGATVTATNETDVICAYKPSPTYAASNTLQFEHIFARISTVTVTATSPYNVSDVTISIVNAKTGGIYNLYTGTGQIDGTGWSSLTPDTETQTPIYTNSGTISAGGSHTGADNDFYLVPGTYWVRATWTATVGDYTQTYSTKNSTGSIFVQGGKVNTISATLSADATQLILGVSVTAWGSAEKTATF